jgi:alpha-galactosidase
LTAAGDGRRPEIDVATEGLPPLVEVAEREPGVHHVRLSLALREPVVPAPLTVSFRYPLTDVHALWRADRGGERIFDISLEPPWASFQTHAARGAPVVCAYAQSGENRLTLAWSDARNPTTARANVDEETGELLCSVTFFDTPAPPLGDYETTLRLDTRRLPYYDALAAVERWWSEMPAYTPAPVPEVAREPVYSTWYGFHLALSADAVEEQCRLARELGCGAVIVDDGWQTETVARGYSSCGDWQPARAKFPDLRGHVERVQRLGLKFFLWFAVPFVGAWSDAWREFEGKTLAYEPFGWDGTWSVLDPRFPEVRASIVATYEHAADVWGVDGFKLDFIDEFQLRAGDDFGGGRDTDSVVEALEQTLDEVTTRLRARNPNVAIEFRQTYTGPLMRRFATMLRAFDCPNDALENRVRTLTLRLLAGSTPVHSDPLMWFPGDTVESAALQLLNVLFAVPQISMRLDRLPEEQLEMLRFWLGFWRAERDVLLDGRLRPLRPDANYPLVLTERDGTLVAAAYGQELVSLERLPATTYLVNATWGDRLVLELAEPAERSILARDCRGRSADSGQRRLDAGFNVLAVPRSGLVELTTAP